MTKSKIKVMYEDVLCYTGLITVIGSVVYMAYYIVSNEPRIFFNW